MEGGPRHLVVGRLRKPHGLKGDVALFPLTDTPEQTFRPGAAFQVLDLAGEVVVGPLELERARAYHREWLVKFRGLQERVDLDPLRGQFLAAPAGELAPPANGEVYLHELEGFAVRKQDGTPLGVVTGYYELPSGFTLEVQGPKREFMLPFRKEFVVEVAGDIAPYGLRRLNHGLRYNGRELAPCKVSWQNEFRLRFAIKAVQPGQLRDMCEQVGLQAVAIRRIRIGKIPLGKMPAGEWRYLPVGERF